MCTRFTQTTLVEAAARQRAIRDPKNNLERFLPLYNIAPTDEALIVVETDEGLSLEKMIFGMIPHWAKDAKMGLNCLNARSETIAEKPSFRDPLKKRRCVVFTDGYYDWKREGKVKTPFRILMKDRRVFSLAALWDEWKSPQGKIYHSFAIVTTEANNLLMPINDRMPVILGPEEEKTWLDRSLQDSSQLTPLLKGYSENEMDFFQVSSKMSRSTYKQPDCLEPAQN